METPAIAPETRAYSYIRFSTPQQSGGDSQSRQTDKAARYAAEHGLTLDTELKLNDLGVSAYRGKNAKAGNLGVFLRAVEDGTVQPGSYLLIENFDRLTRDDIPDAVPLLMQIVNSGIVVVTLTNNEVYSRERLRQEPWAMHIVLSELIRANQESFRKSQLVGDAKARKRVRLAAGELKGKPYTRQTPAWIKWDDNSEEYALVPKRAEIVREVFKLADSGWGLDRIAKDFNKRRIETWASNKGRRAAYWHGSYLRKIVASKAAIGLFTPHKTARDKDTGARKDIPLDAVPLWPAAVDEDVYWRVRRRFDTTAPRGKNASGYVKSLVAGVAKCTCGGSMIRISKGATKGKHYVYLLCGRANAKARGCAHLPVHYEDVEKALRVNARTIVKCAPRGKNTEQLEKQIVDLQGHVDALDGDVYALAILAAREKSPAAAKLLRDKERELEGHRATLRELRAQRDTLTVASVRGRLDNLEKALTREPFDIVEANQALRQTMKKIVIEPLAANLEIHWHHSEETEDVPFYTRHKKWD